MLGWKYLSFIGLLLILNTFKVVAEGEDPALPACEFSETANEDGTKVIACKKDEKALGNTVCIDSAKNKIYQSSTGKTQERKREGTSSCVDITSETIASSNYAVFSCTTAEGSGTTCTTFDLTGTESAADGATLVLYYNKSGTIQQKTDFTYLANKKLLICKSGECTLQDAPGYYVITGSSNVSSPLIQLTTGDGGSVTAAEVKTGNTSKAYVAHDGKIITCATTSECTATNGAVGAVYLNAAGTTGKPIIQCTEGDQPQQGRKRATGDQQASAVTCAEAESGLGEGETSIYYVNAKVGAKPVIECTSRGCSDITVPAGAHYLTVEGGVIECKTTSECEVKTDIAGGEVFLNSAVTSKTANALIECPAASSDEADKDTRRRVARNSDEEPAADPQPTEQQPAATTGGCKLEDGIPNNYYKNAGSNSGTLPLIFCTSSKCEEVVGAAGTYLDGSTYKEGTNDAAATYTNLIVCTAGSGSTKRAAAITCDNSGEVTEGIYLNAASTGITDALIKCIGGEGTGEADPADPTNPTNPGGRKRTENELTCSKKAGIDKDYYLNAAATGKLISCTSSTCGPVDEIVAGTYLDGSTYDKKEEAEPATYTNLIVCGEGKGDARKRDGITCANPVTVTDGIYLNGAQTELADALIECTGGDGSTDSVKEDTVEDPDARKKRATGETGPTCSKKAGVNKDYYLNVAESSQLISCNTSKCEEVAEDKIVAATYLDGSTYAKDKEGTVTYTNLIVCGGDDAGANKRDGITCDNKGDVKDGIYLNGAQTELADALIKCTGGEGSTGEGGDTEIPAANAGQGRRKRTESESAGSSEGPTCSKKAGVNKDYYLNVAESSQLISCDTTKCVEVADGDIVAGTYLDGSTNASGVYSKLIVCPASDDAAAKKRSEGEDGCKSGDATEGIYVNAPETGLTDGLISCKTEGDAVTCSKDTGVNKGYYLNAGSDNTENPLIKCSSRCEGIALKEDEDAGSLVFLNANYKVGKDEKNPLIKCPPGEAAVEGEGGSERKRVDPAEETEETEETESTGSCGLATSAAVAEVPEFYVNGDRINSESDEDGPLKTDIIKCVKNESSSKRATTLEFTCSVSSQSTKPDDVFINGNYAVSKKQLIKCTNEGGCIEASAFSEEVEEGEARKRQEGAEQEETKVESGDASKSVYYVNAGSAKKDKLQDTLIECPSSDAECKIKVAASEQIYINANTNLLILCYETSGCVAKIPSVSENNNEFYMNSIDTTADLTNDLIKCFLDENGDKKCEAYTGVENKVYINSYNTTQLIYCLKEEGCKLKDSAATAERPEYYVNGDDIDFESSTPEETEERRRGESEGSATDKRPLIGDLIECKVNGSVIKCSVINGHLGDVYINANYDNDKTYQIIQCPDTGCVNDAVSEDIDEKLPDYYINSGNKAKDKFAEALIKCSKAGEACEVIEAKANEVYVNSNENQPDKQIIKCAKNSCSAVASAATESSKEYYINAGKASDSPLEYDIIECSVGSGEDPADDATKTKRAEEVTISCSCVKEAKAGVYMNTNYSESGDNNQLIQCTSDNGCVGVRTTSVEYYVNAESSDLANAIIFCSNKKCEKQTPSDINIYYVGKDSDNVNGLIECVETTEAETATEEEKEGTPEIDEEEQNGGEPEARKRAAGDTVNKCTLKSAFTSQGYYLNSGYNKSVNQTIICDSTDGCNTVKVDLGYYVNAGNADKPIIKCEKEGNECVEEASKPCPDPAKAVPGNYCYEDSQLKFFTVNNSTAIAASKSDDTYAFATIPSNGFPGIKSETGALFKISRYFINRFYQSGVIMIDKNGKLVDSLGGDTSDISLYDCNDSTKVCTERPGCTSNTYMFDSENRKAVFCNDGTLEYASFTGYVVDGNRVTSGTKHPYIIHCENGEKCTSFKPKSSTYYENSGYDASTNSLIQCNSNNCMTVVANVGYYVGHGESDNNGVIKCTTATSCTYSQVKNKVKYVNAGFDKRNNAIIECKGGKCSVAKAKSGYYLTHTSTLLIQCTSPTTCAEFTPTVNYYDNADSSESNNTIINCVQNSNVVTCSSEATNNGFYMSSLSNVLIRCKAGHKCKTIVVKNGIFRGALKGLTSNKRSDNVQNVHERDADDDSEEDGKMVNLRDNSDDAYGVIRCVAGKCAALSASELAAIPMCEFNNNKCYITLEYAMTKSATTSIAAGNICTNSDRSVFYFATDTVVVKPNVISGVTSTYVYTTTNSNCLEVNDSYNDMYFTVGSNIYTLDQGSVLQFYETGYYFLNVAKNTLVSGNEIDAYNDENVKLYRCNGSSCSIIDKPDANTYYADVNKRILKYNVNNDVYTFAYEKDIICIFANNKCTPNADLKNQEFCITYKGEIVLATTDIKNRETGECYRAGTINNYIYGYSQHLYHMNQFAAEMVDQTGFYIISLSTNTTVVSKNYKNKNNSIVVYGCNLSSCRVYEPDENTYYYDAQAKNILRYKDGVWSSPSASGYAYIALNPTTSYIYKFAKKGDEVIIQGKANYGYYYTIDNEMYHCDQEDGECKPIDETGYYFTNAGEIYYCVHDSEGLEITECVKQNCVSGQYYYIDDAYYRCEVSSLLVPVVSRYCSYDDNVVVNFPLALTEEFPDKIKQAVDDIQKNNNSTAVVTRRGKNYLEAVSGIFTNCTYNVEETKSTFDLVCVNNYVSMDKETDEVKICNVDQLGYVECIEDEDNPEKCKVSGAFHAWKLSIFMTVAVVFFAMIMNN